MQVTIEIPDALGHRFANAGKDAGRTALESLALEGYRNELMSEAEVGEMLGFATGLEVHAFLADHDVDLNYSPKDWEHDKQVADENVRHRALSGGSLPTQRG